MNDAGAPTWAVEEASAPIGADGQALSTRGERTRRRLLDAAEAVFAGQGYHEASIVKITEAAGVAQGTFYRYFPGKQAIFEELVEDLNRRVRHAMADASGRAASRAEAERLGFGAFFAFTAEHPALYRIIRQAEFASLPALKLHYERIAEGYVQGLSRAMAAGEIAEADPLVLAWALMGVGELVGMRWILWDGDGEAGGDGGDGDGDGGAGIPPEVFEQLLAFVRRGLGVRGDAP